MNKEQFNQLEVLEQIQYINDNIEGMSLTKLCEEIGVNRSTLTKRFKAKGYTFNKELNKYINEVPTEPLKSNVGASEGETDTNTLLNMIRALEDRVQKLEEQSNQTTTTQQQNNNKKEIRFYKSNDLVVRAYKIDSEVQQRFKAYCEENSQYKVSDIITTAIENFLNDME